MYDMHKGMHANHLYALQINQITFTPPDIPILSQYGDVDEVSVQVLLYLNYDNIQWSNTIYMQLSSVYCSEKYW